MTTATRTTRVYKDSDGWWADLSPGLKDGSDPLATCHTLHEQTRSRLTQAIREVTAVWM